MGQINLSSICRDKNSLEFDFQGQPIQFEDCKPKQQSCPPPPIYSHEVVEEKEENTMETNVRNNDKNKGAIENQKGISFLISFSFFSQQFENMKIEKLIMKFFC